MKAPPPLVALAEADSVFIGTVKSLSNELSGDLEVSFDVETRWKGPGEDRIPLRTRPDGASCGYPFQVGTKYLVYAYKRSDTDRLFTGLCQRTKPLSDAQAELSELGPGIPPIRANGNPLNDWVGGALFSGFIAYLLIARARRRLKRVEMA